MKVSPAVLVLALAASLAACSGSGMTPQSAEGAGVTPPVMQSAPLSDSAAAPSPSAEPSDAPADSAASPKPEVSNWSQDPVDKAWANGSTHGGWQAQFNGSGTIRVVANEDISNALELDPKVSTSAKDTHAALVTTTANFDDFDVTVNLQTVKQLRAHSSPKQSEVGSFLWHYTDDQHYYFFVPKTKGWELGKKDPAYPGGQRILASGSSPAFPIGTLQKIRVVQSGDAITVYDNGLKIVSFTDTQSSYESGRFGLYSADSQAHFGSLNLTTSAGTQVI